MFAEEKPYLQPLPLEPFRYYQYGKRTVHMDGCVEVDAAYYGAPPGWIGARSMCSGTRCTCACSIRAPASCCASIWDRSAAGIASALKIVHGARRRIRCGCSREPTRREPASAQCATRSIIARVRLGLRRIQGVLALVKKYGCAASDDACAAALELGVAEYRFVRRYLERSPQAPLTLRQVDPLIRELTQYRDLIQQRINFEETNP